VIDTTAMQQQRGNNNNSNNNNNNNKPVCLAAAGDGQHYLALTEAGEVWSWGSGDGGRLGSVVEP
jgi:alpha-tubulin suppressor-like RCC1 family protein